MMIKNEENLKKTKVEKIDFDELANEYKVDNIDMFISYLKEIFKDLSERSDDKSLGLNSMTFSKYYELPGIISQRLFTVLDYDNNNYLDILEFTEGMVCLFSETFENLAKFIFNLYDFDKDGLISKEDVRVVVSYVPLNTQFKVGYLKLKYEKETFKDRIESQEELHVLIAKAFNYGYPKDKITFDNFLQIIENVSSDIFLFILIFLYENRPFTKTTLENYKLAKLKSTNSFKSSRSPDVSSTNKFKLIASPSLNSKFFPSVAISMSPVILKKSIALEFNKSAKIDLLTKLSGTSNKGDPRNVLLKYVSQPPIKKESKFSNSNNMSKNLNNDIKSIPVQRKNRNTFKNIECLETSKLFFIDDKEMSDFPITPAYKYKTEGIIDNYSKNIVHETDHIDDDEEEIENQEVKYEGYLFKINSSKKMKRLWFKLLHKDLYYYKNPEERTHKGMHNISGVYVNEEKGINYDTICLYCFSIVNSQKSRYFYVDNEQEFKNWISAIRRATGYKNLTDIYDIGEKLGNGKFGLVRLGLHIKSGRKVAVKILSKIQMSIQDLGLVRTEIEILKICQHPSIIRLYDILENLNYIYIIMEYCSGGDLFSYIENKGFKLTEFQAARLIHKICTAIYYLHSYGIAHRDLKPENIIMTDKSDNADLKLLDFGLSKIIGPNEVCNEPYGTLSYVAPEVLMEKPYTNSVDLWSIGIITYLLLSGSLPFDHESSDKEIARQTIFYPVLYPENIWDKISPEGNSFVKDLLQKDPLCRINIKQALEHTWLQKFNESLMHDKRKNSNNFIGSTFKLYTTTTCKDNN